MAILEGIKIIDFTQGYTGTFSTMLLADFGAEVIKVEPPVTGNAERSYFPCKGKGSAYSAFINRNKKSVTIDIDTPKGQELAMKLIKEADIVCDSFPVGKLEACHLAYEDAVQEKEDIIYASLTAFGKTGPMGAIKGADINAQAMCGLMALTGFPENKATTHGSRICDQYGGVFLAYAIVLAMIAKYKDGIGQKVDIGEADCMFTALEGGEVNPALTGKDFDREGNHSQLIAPYDTFKTNDGYYSTAISTDGQWNTFCDVMGMQDIKEDSRFANNDMRGRNYVSELRGLLRDRFALMSKYEIDEVLAAENLPGGPLQNVEEVLNYPQLKERKMFLTLKDETIGEVTMPANPIKLSEDGPTYESAPALGKDTEKYLKAVGVTNEEMAELKMEKVI